jgi:hypothetical protein
MPATDRESIEMGSRKKGPAGTQIKLEQKGGSKPSRKTTIAAKASHPILREALPRASAPAPVVRVFEVPAARREGTGDAVACVHKSLAAAAGMLAINRKIMEMIGENIGSGLGLVRGLARAETPIHSLQLQMDFWRGRMGALATQAWELRELSAELMTKAASASSS